MWQQKLSNTTTSVIAQYPSVLAETVQPAGVFMKKPSRRKGEEKDTDREGERNGKQPKVSPFPPHRTHALFNRSLRFYLLSPSFLPSIPLCLSSSPAPEAPTFPPLSLGVYGLVRCRKQRVSFVLFCCGFCPLLGVQSLLHLLRALLPSHSVCFAVHFGFRGFVSGS
jgi:hypothetical protein